MTGQVETSTAEQKDAVRKRSLRDLQKEETLQLLLKSATYLFLRKGYASTTIEEIASRAGASRATFYLHFGRKWHVVRHIAEATILPEALDFYRRLDILGVPAREDLRSWLLDALDFFEQHKRFLSVYRQAKSIEPEIDHHNVMFLRRCVDAMPNYLDRWGPDGATFAKLRLNMLTTQLDDAATWAIRDEEGVTRDLVLEALLEYWTVGLRSPH